MNIYWTPAQVEAALEEAKAQGLPTGAAVRRALGGLTAKTLYTYRQRGASKIFALAMTALLNGLDP